MSVGLLLPTAYCLLVTLFLLLLLTLLAHVIDLLVDLLETFAQRLLKFGEELARGMLRRAHRRLRLRFRLGLFRFFAHGVDGAVQFIAQRRLM